MNVETGLFEGYVTSSDPKHDPYKVRINAHEKTMRCTCVDYERNLHACKHLIAFSRVCKMVVHGIHLDGTSQP